MIISMNTKHTFYISTVYYAVMQVDPDKQEYQCTDINLLHVSIIDCHYESCVI